MSLIANNWPKRVASGISTVVVLILFGMMLIYGEVSFGESLFGSVLAFALLMFALKLLLTPVAWIVDTTRRRIDSIEARRRCDRLAAHAGEPPEAPIVERPRSAGHHERAMHLAARWERRLPRASRTLGATAILTPIVSLVVMGQISGLVGTLATLAALGAFACLGVHMAGVHTMMAFRHAALMTQAVVSADESDLSLRSSSADLNLSKQVIRAEQDDRLAQRISIDLGLPGVKITLVEHGTIRDAKRTWTFGDETFDDATLVSGRERELAQLPFFLVDDARRVLARLLLQGAWVEGGRLCHTTTMNDENASQSVAKWWSDADRLAELIARQQRGPATQAVNAALRGAHSATERALIVAAIGAEARSDRDLVARAWTREPHAAEQRGALLSYLREPLRATCARELFEDPSAHPWARADAWFVATAHDPDWGSRELERLLAEGDVGFFDAVGVRGHLHQAQVARWGPSLCQRGAPSWARVPAARALLSAGANSLEAAARQWLEAPPDEVRGRELDHLLALERDGLRGLDRTVSRYRTALQLESIRHRGMLTVSEQAPVGVGLLTVEEDDQSVVESGSDTQLEEASTVAVHAEARR